MKAIRIHDPRGELRYEDVPAPSLTAPTDVIVRLEAAGLSDGALRMPCTVATTTRGPRIPGGEGAGVVTEIGAQVRNVKPGDVVCLYPLTGCGFCESCLADREFMCAEACMLGQAGDGTYAEYARVPARNCFPMPQELSCEEAAALPVAYLTVWRMLVTNGRLKPGESVLIVGGDGATDAAALQIAHRLGARVIVAFGGDEKIAQGVELGAAHGIDRDSVDFAKEVRRLTAKRGVDVVVNCIGGESWTGSLAALAKGGRLVTCGGGEARSDVRRIFWNHLQIFGSTLGSREDFRRMLRFIETTRTKPILDEIFLLPAAAAAHERLEHRRPLGKIVLRVKS